METADISRLASDLEGNTRRDSPSFLPSLQQMYRLGLVLFRIQQNKKNPKQIEGDSVVTAYRELIESIPDESLSGLFGDLQKASQRLLQSNNKSPQDLALAVRSMEGLIGAFSDSDSFTCKEMESNSRLCRVVYQSAWVSTLSALYDRFIVFEKQQQSNSLSENELESTKTGILSCLSRLVLDGLVLAGEEVEESLLDAIRAMEEESTDCLRDLQAWQNREEPFRRNLQDSILAIGSNSNSSIANEDEALERAQQREYIISMLESARAEPSSMAVPRSESKARASQATTTTTTTTTTTNTNQSTSELDRRIQQVLQILPHFGEGFVEVALGLHQGDVESTVATLLNHPIDGSSAASGYPTALRVLDPKLPRRKREFRAYQTAEEEAHSALEARRDVKERMALEEKQKQDQYDALVVASAASQQQQQQNEAAQASEDASNDAPAPLPDKKLTRKELRQQKLRQLRIRDEYDDDYDDQYDESDIKLGAADDGFTSDNMTFEQVKLYNQVVQEDQSDSAFWESNRNTNQKASKNNSGEKKWGPDKIRGGRVIGADGKIVRKPGGVKKKKANNNNRNNNSGQNNSNKNGSNNNNNTNNKGPGGKPKANNNNPNNNNNNGNNNSNSAANNGNKKKPKTKPRSDNRVNRQRDRKMKKQGAFGVQD